MALIESGVDVIQTDAANSQIGVYRSIERKGTLVLVMFLTIPQVSRGFFGYVGVSLCKCFPGIAKPC